LSEHEPEQHRPARVPQILGPAGFRWTLRGCGGSQIQPVPRVAQASHVDFLSGLVTIESGMIALIDLPHLLSVSISDSGDAAASGPQAAA